MSYDLLVFDADVAPIDRGAFIAWYDDLTEWKEPHRYNDPAVTAPKLRAWYDAISAGYPNMNGDVSDYGYDNPRLTDYSIGQHAIYAAFAWSVAEDAYQTARQLAEQHGVGFFDVSADDGDILHPS